MCVASWGVSEWDIQYEVFEDVIDYFDPVSGKKRRYHPDFRIGNTVYEIKDLASLGILSNAAFIFGSPRDEFVATIKAKYEAAKQSFSDYRMFVFHLGKFQETVNFWEPSEGNRLRKALKN
jgi:hypothetical protein